MPTPDNISTFTGLLNTEEGFYAFQEFLMREFAAELAEVFGSYEGEKKLRVILADDGSEAIDGGGIVKRDFGA